MPCDQIVARAPPSALVPPHGRPFASAERAPSQRQAGAWPAPGQCYRRWRHPGSRPGSARSPAPSRRRPGRPPGGPGGPASRSPRGYPPRTARLRPGPARRGVSVASQVTAASQAAWEPERTSLASRPAATASISTNSGPGATASISTNSGPGASHASAPAARTGCSQRLPAAAVRSGLPEVRAPSVTLAPYRSCRHTGLGYGPGRIALSAGQNAGPHDLDRFTADFCGKTVEIMICAEAQGVRGSRDWPRAVRWRCGISELVSSLDSRGVVGQE